MWMWSVKTYLQHGELQEDKDFYVGTSNDYKKKTWVGEELESGVCYGKKRRTRGRGCVSAAPPKERRERRRKKKG